MRVVGLPLHMWSREVFKKISDGFKGFIAVDEDATFFSELQWAKILVKMVGKELPGSLEIVVGLGCVVVQLWWEIHPLFVQVVLTSESCSIGAFGDREEEKESLCANSCGSQRGRVVQDEVQRGVKDVSNSEGRQKGVVAISVVSPVLGSKGRFEKGGGGLIPERGGEE